MASAPDLDAVALQMARSVRAHRRSRGMSISQLAAKAALAKTSLSKIESGTGNPSLETLWRIANALDVPLGALLTADAVPATRVIRAEEGTRVEGESGLRARLILGEGRAHRTEIFEAKLPQGSDYRSQPHVPGTIELVLCQSGSMLVGPEREEVALAPGDALWFPADLPHRYAALEDSTGLIIMSYPPAAGE